tara:strand:- start:138375 stop:138563 length:189 start_codon:yes stop_codon:yes gene_type:complete
MSLRTKREETVCITCSKLFEDVFALTDIETLKFKAINKLVTQSVQRLTSSLRMFFSAHDHFP